MTPLQVSFTSRAVGEPGCGRGRGWLWRARFGVVCLGALTGSWAVSACSTPVFQYALENWPPDVYDLVIVHHGPLGAETMAAAEAAVRGDGSGGVNAGLRSREDEGVPEGEVRLTARFPGQPSERGPLWTGAWSPDRLRALLDSPLRQRLAEELVRGASAVFLFLPGGDAEADTAARSRLGSCLEELARTLELPAPDETAPEDPPEGAAAPAIRFSILDVPREAPDEEFLRTMLRASEPDLSTVHEPMVFPVFGRGRLLYAIVGGGINREVLAETCSFLTGSCSCQVKAQNPGVDLLLRADWERALGGVTMTLEELPPLTGLGATPERAVPAEPATEPPTPVPAGSGSLVGRRVVWAGGAALLIVLAGTLAVLLRRR